jgi:UDP-glucose 4-epimerase
MSEARGNLIVTGGLGFLGAHAIVEIISANDMHGFDKIIIVDNQSNSSAENLAKIMEIVGYEKAVNFEFESIDLNDKQALERVFEMNKPITSVLHFAFLNDSSKS